MLFDFQKLAFDSFGRVEAPTLILCNPDKYEIGALGYAKNIKPSIRLDDLCELTFAIPEKVVDEKNGEIVLDRTPLYDMVVGKRLILIEPFGYFILENPKETNDGVTCWKECKAKSLEAEFAQKKISGLDGTYPLYDWLNPQNTDTVVGVILSLMPSWKIGYVDSNVWNYWRTFKISEQNLYNFMKSTIQKTYQCFFQFDTYKREISVYSLEGLKTESEVYLSLDNLIKKIDVEELSEDIITCLEVSGAGDVDIRAVNPRGDNRIYDFDYFMTPEWFPDETGENGLIAKWKQYKTQFDLSQKEYSALNVKWRIFNSLLLSERTKLTNLEREYTVNKEAQGALIDNGITSVANAEYKKRQDNLLRLAKEIADQKQVVADAEKKIADNDKLLSDINKSLKFANWFTAEQIAMLDNITYEDGLVADAFVYTDHDFAGTPLLSSQVQSGTLTIHDGTITRPADNDGMIYYVTNNTLVFSYISEFDGVLKNCLVEVTLRDGLISINTATKTFLLTANIAEGTANDGTNTYPFQNGILTYNGSYSSLNDTSNTFTVNALSGNVYATEGVTAMGRQAVVEELYAYGLDTFEKLSVPSYQFSVDSVNFFFLEDYKPFLKTMRTGSTVALEIAEGKLVYPILLQVDLDYEQEAQLKLTFSNKLRYDDAFSNLADLLEQSISRGKDTASGRFDFGVFKDSNAQTALREMYTSSLDTAKNAILSGKGQVQTWDSSGLRLRQLLDDETYSPEETWLNHNSIVFTRDGWNSAAQALGKVQLETNWFYGVVGEAIVGKILAGESLHIEAHNKSNKTLTFRVDGSGVTVNNGIFTVANGVYNIVLDAEHGILAGSNLYKYDGDALVVNSINNNNLKLYFDIKTGDLYLKGQVHADSGYFDGDIYARDLFLGSGNTSVLNSLDQVKGTSLDLREVKVWGNDAKTLNSFSVDLYGKIILGNGNNSITVNNGAVTLGSGVTIQWAKVTEKPPDLVYQATIDKIMRGEYYGGTFIDGNKIYSPNLLFGTNGASGHLKYGQGHDGQSTTDIIEMLSNKGIVINAQGGGMRIEATSGIWLNSQTLVKHNGSYVDVGEKLASHDNSIDSINRSISSLRDAIRDLQSRPST